MASSTLQTAELSEILKQHPHETKNMAQNRLKVFHRVHRQSGDIKEAIKYSHVFVNINVSNPQTAKIHCRRSVTELLELVNSMKYYDLNQAKTQKHSFRIIVFILLKSKLLFDFSVFYCIQILRQEMIQSTETRRDRSPDSAHNTKDERLGDWVCVKCNNLNFSFRKKCNRCKNQSRQQNDIDQAQRQCQENFYYFYYQPAEIAYFPQEHPVQITRRHSIDASELQHHGFQLTQPDRCQDDCASLSNNSHSEERPQIENLSCKSIPKTEASETNHSQKAFDFDEFTWSTVGEITAPNCRPSSLTYISSQEELPFPQTHELEHMLNKILV